MAGDQLVERALGDGPAVVDDDGVLAQVLDEVELVRREQHRGAAASFGDEDLRQRVDGDRVEAGERLVEDQDVGLVDEGADQLDALLVAEREVLEVAATARSARPRRSSQLAPAGGPRCACRGRGAGRGSAAGRPRASSGTARAPRAGSRSAAGRRRRPAAPSQRTSPASRAVSPKIARIVVVLPAPLGPRNPVTAPGRTVNDIPSRARTVPYVRTSSIHLQHVSGPYWRRWDDVPEHSPRVPVICHDRRRHASDLL